VGFSGVRVFAIEGPVWCTPCFAQARSNDAERNEIIRFLSLLEEKPSIQGASAHLLAMAQR
jgi:hypothetical protein